MVPDTNVNPAVEPTDDTYAVTLKAGAPPVLLTVKVSVNHSPTDTGIGEIDGEETSEAGRATDIPAEPASATGKPDAVSTPELVAVNPTVPIPEALYVQIKVSEAPIARTAGPVGTGPSMGSSTPALGLISRSGIMPEASPAPELVTVSTTWTHCPMTVTGGVIVNEASSTASVKSVKSV